MRKRITVIAAVVLSSVALVLMARTFTQTVWYQEWRYGHMALAQLTVAARQQPENPTVLYFLGKSLNAAQRYKEALVPLEHAAGLDPLDARIRSEWSTAQLAGGYITGAFGQLTQFVHLNPNSAEGHMALGRFYVAQNAYTRAQEELEQAVRLDARLGEAWSLLAGAYHHMGDYGKARDAAQKAVALRPNNAVDHVLLATVLTMANDLPGARDEYKKATALTPNEPQYLCGYASLLLKIADTASLAEAEQVARRALTLDPHSLEASYPLGKALLEQGKAEEAIAPLTTAANTVSDGTPRSTLPANRPELFLDPAPAQDLSRAYRKLGKEQDAIFWQEQYLRQQATTDEGRRLWDAVRSHPDSVEAQRQRGLFLARKGDVEGVAKSFAKVLHAATDAPTVLVASANALAEAGHGMLGVPLARRAAIFSPNSPAAYEAWGNALLADGHLHDAAVKYARAAGWWSEKMPVYRQKLAVALREHKAHPTEAEKVYAQAIDLQRANLGTSINAGQTQKLLERAVALDPRDTDSRRALVRLLVRRHELPEAEKMARELLQLSPEDVVGNAMLAYILLQKVESDADLAEAEKHLNTAELWLNEEPSSAPTIHFGRGVVALRRNQIKDAVRFLRQSAEEDPSGEATYFQLVRAERRAGNTAAAEKAQTELLRRQERKQKSLDLLNRIADKPDDRKRYQEAIQFFHEQGMTAQATAVEMEAERRFGAGKSS